MTINPGLLRVSSWVLGLLCPVLVAIYPLLTLFTENQTDLEVSVLWEPLAYCLLGAVASFGIIVLLTRRPATSGVLASLVVLGFAYHGLVSAIGPSWLGAVFLAVLAVAFVLVVRAKGDALKLATVVAVGAIVMTLPQVVGILRYQAANQAPSATDPRLWPTALDAPVLAAGAPRPDIYVIVPDDYARADVLEQYFHYDDSAFVHDLESRGFVVSSQSRSPYSDSESNIAALVNMDYLSSFADVLGKTSEDVRPVQRVIEDNRAARLLGSIGYDYVHIDTDEVTFAGGNPDISALAPPDSFMNLWLEQSVLGSFGGPIGFDQSARDARFRTSITSEFHRLVSLPETNRPKFVVFHTLLPHDPYLYDANGRPVTFPGTSEEDLASGLGRAYYLDQLRFVSTKLIESVDTILANATTPPVIVIQSDEGFQANPEPFGEAAMQDIRVKGLAAFYLPDTPGALDSAGPEPQPPNSVNDLRFVFNRYLGTHYEMLPTASYPEGDYPYEFHEIQVR